MKLIGYQDADKVMIGTVAADGAITPICEREGFWRDPKRHLADIDPKRAPVRNQRDVRQVHAVPSSARVLCIGLNYRNHALEGGRSIELPTVPVIFE